MGTRTVRVIAVPRRCTSLLRQSATLSRPSVFCSFIKPKQFFKNASLGRMYVLVIFREFCSLYLSSNPRDGSIIRHCNCSKEYYLPVMSTRASAFESCIELILRHPPPQMMFPGNLCSMLDSIESLLHTNHVARITSRSTLLEKFRAVTGQYVRLCGVLTFSQTPNSILCEPFGTGFHLDVINWSLVLSHGTC